MGKEDLKNRENWQEESGKLASEAEVNFYAIFKGYCESNKDILKFYEKPKHFDKIYSDKILDPELEKSIHTPEKIGKWGVQPDFAIEHLITKKIIFGEIKHQEGWIEGGTSSDGRGNAHERCFKLFSPGLLKKYREVSKITDSGDLPFWVVFNGNITRDPKRVREISFLFDNFSNHYFLWQDKTKLNLIKHFETHILPILEKK